MAKSRKQKFAHVYENGRDFPNPEKDFKKVAIDIYETYFRTSQNGNTNTMTLTQRNDGTTSSEHYMNLDLDSSSNVITMQQIDNGDLKYIGECI